MSLKEFLAQPSVSEQEWAERLKKLGIPGDWFKIPTDATPVSWPQYRASHTAELPLACQGLARLPESSQYGRQPKPAVDPSPQEQGDRSQSPPQAGSAGPV